MYIISQLHTKVSINGGTPPQSSRYRWIFIIFPWNQLDYPAIEYPHLKTLKKTSWKPFICNYLWNHLLLVGGIPTPLNNMSQLRWWHSQSMESHNLVMFQTTNQVISLTIINHYSPPFMEPSKHRWNQTNIGTVPPCRSPVIPRWDWSHCHRQAECPRSPREPRVVSGDGAKLREWWKP